jgi:hypothetical protein
LQKIKVLDEKTNMDYLGIDGWTKRYEWEKELTIIYK